MQSLNSFVFGPTVVTLHFFLSTVIFSEALTWAEPVGLLNRRKCSAPSNLQSVKFERCRVLINIVRKVVFRTSAVTPFLAHFMVALFITQDAFLMPFGLISFLQS